MRSWPLTARGSQLELLGDGYADPSQGGCVIVGAAGVGKTRLAAEAARLAKEADRPTAQAIGHPATQHIPLGAIAHLLPHEVVRVGFGPDERAALFHTARAALSEPDADQRLLLTVDDIDQLDELSLSLLVPLVYNRSVYLIATLRAGRILPAAVAALVKDGLLQRMELASLSEDQVATLLHRVLDGPTDEAATRRFQTLSQGNLQLLRELLRGALDQGALARRDATWTLVGEIDTAPLEELVLARLSSVDPDGRRVLDLLAVAGSIGLVGLERLSPPPVLEGLETRDLITVARDGRRTEVRLAHPLYYEVLRARLPVLRERSLQRELADLLESFGARRREDTLRLASWRLNAGGAVEPEVMLGAARLALAARDMDLACRFADAAAGLGAQTGAAALVKAEALLHDGQVQSAEELIAQTWARSDLTDEQLEHLARRSAELRLNAGADIEGALARNAEAQRRVTAPSQLASLHGHRGVLLATAARSREALAEADRAMALDQDDPRLAVEIATVRAIAHLCLGRFEEAAEDARSAQAHQERLPEWLAGRGMARHLVNEAHALAYSGRLAAARQLVEPALERARASGAVAAVLWFDLTLGEIDRDAGQAHDALARFRRVAANAASIGQSLAVVWARVGVAQSLLLLGDVDAAAEALADADQAGSNPLVTSWSARARTRGWLLAAQGDLPGARALLAETAAQVQAEEVYPYEAALRHDLARFGDAASQVERLHALASLVTGPFVAAHALHARGVATRSVTTLQQALDLYDETGAAVHAAETAAELAEQYQRDGNTRAATAARQRMTGILQRCGGARTPRLITAAGGEPLTERERQVALMAAGGLTSKEIAGRLFLSSRTVETHLDRVYRKLGVAGRDELRRRLSA